MFIDAAKALLCVAVLLFAAPRKSAGQPAAFDIKVEAISHGTVAVRFQVSGISGPTLNSVEYGPSHLMRYRTPTAWSGTASPRRSIVIGGLKPDSRYYFRVVSRAANGDATATWYCRSSEGGPGYACDGPDAPPTFRTAPAPGEAPASPIAPEVTEHPFPDVTGETFTVAVDEQRRCLDLQEKLDSAAAADSEKNHQIIIPAGATCYGEFVLRRKLGSGVVLIRPSTPLELLPPPGVRIDPSFKPLMATLSIPATWKSPGLLHHLALTTPHEASCPAPCTEGWRLTGIEITHPDHSSLPPRHARIAAISEWRPGSTRITLDRALPLEYGQSIAIAGVDGFPALNRVWTVNPLGADSFAVDIQAPSEGASGGYVTQALSLHVESCGPGPRPVCKTALPHGLSDSPSRAISSIKNTDLGTGGAYWPLMSTVELSGTPSGADGLWGAHSIGGGLRLIGSVPAGSCNGDCGTAKLRPSLQVFAFDAEPRLNGSRIYSVVSETEVRLDDVEESTAETSGGYLTVDPNHYPRLVSFGANGRNIVLDRCWIHGRGFPSRVAGAVAIASDDSAMVDSVVSNINSWRPVTPQGGSADPGAHGYFAGAATVFTLGDAARVEIRNNLFENCIGITVYAEQYRSTQELTPSDVLITGNTFRNDDAYRSGSADSNGRYYGIRHAIEFKRGQRIRIDGNVFDGNWADWTPLGPAIGLLTRADGEAANNRVQDVAIRNNVFRRVATGIQILSTDDRLELPSLPTARIAIDNNLFESINFYKMRSAPSGVALIYRSSNYGGQVLYASGSLEDVSITRNTAIDLRGRGPAFFWYRNGRSSSVKVTDNVFAHNDDFSLGGLPRAQHVSQFESQVQGPASAAFAHVFTQTPDADPSSAFARNLILPGVRDSSSEAAFDDSRPGRNFTKADCQAFYVGFPQIECAGSGEAGETANQRLASVFPDRTVLRDPGGRGADLKGLAASTLRIEAPAIAAQANGAVLEFRTSSPETCLVDVSETSEFSQFQRFQDAGGEQHTVSLEGLVGGQTYHYRVKCASDTLFGEIGIPAAGNAGP